MTCCLHPQYEDLVAAGTATTYDNTTINFSYNEDDEVLGEWQDRTQAKAYVEDAAYPYGKVSSVLRPTNVSDPRTAELQHPAAECIFGK